MNPCYWIEIPCLWSCEIVIDKLIDPTPLVTLFAVLLIWYTINCYKPYKYLYKPLVMMLHSLFTLFPIDPWNSFGFPNLSTILPLIKIPRIEPCLFLIHSLNFEFLKLNLRMSFDSKESEWFHILGNDKMNLVNLLFFLLKVFQTNSWWIGLGRKRLVGLVQS